MAGHLYLQPEETLSKGLANVVDQVLKEVERFTLVLDQRILLATRSILDGVPQLIEVVQMILPLLIEHLQHEVREQLLGEILRAVPLFDLLPRCDLGSERIATGLLH